VPFRPPRHPAGFCAPHSGLSRDGASAVADQDAAGRRRLRDIVKSHPLEVVAQEVVKLSTMPVDRQEA